MTSSSQESEKLLNIAEQNGLKIYVDHKFIFTGAVCKIHSLITAGEIGELYYFD